MILSYFGCCNESYHACVREQEPVTKKYPAELSITAMMYLFGTIQSTVLAAFATRHPSEWKLQSGLELANVFFGVCITTHPQLNLKYMLNRLEK